MEKLEKTPPGSKARANQLRDVFYRSRHNYEFSAELANADIIKKILIQPVNGNVNENERHWAAAVLENVTVYSDEGKQKCYDCGGLGVIMKRIYKEKHQTETRRSCIVAMTAVIRLNREVKDTCVKFGAVKMLMELLEEYDSQPVGADITFALGHLIDDLPDKVVSDVANRGGCDKLVRRIQNNLNRHDRRYGLWTLTNLLEKTEKSRDKCIKQKFHEDLIEYIENDYNDEDGIKLDAVHCLKLLAEQSEDVQNSCKDKFLLIFLQPLGENPNYTEADLEEKVKHVNELATILGGDPFTLKKTEDDEEGEKKDEEMKVEADSEEKEPQTKTETKNADGWKWGNLTLHEEESKIAQKIFWL